MQGLKDLKNTRTVLSMRAHLLLQHLEEKDALNVENAIPGTATIGKLITLLFRVWERILRVGLSIW